MDSGDYLMCIDSGNIGQATVIHLNKTIRKSLKNKICTLLDLLLFNLSLMYKFEQEQNLFFNTISDKNL